MRMGLLLAGLCFSLTSPALANSQGQDDKIIYKNNRPFKVLTNTFATKIKTPNAKSKGKVIKSTKTHVFYQAEGNQAANIPQDAYQAVINESSQEMGYLSGIIEIEPLSISQAEVIAQDYNIKVIRSFPAIKRFFCRSHHNVDLVDLVKRIKSDARVKAVSLEIITSQDIPVPK